MKSLVNLKLILLSLLTALVIVGLGVSFQFILRPRPTPQVPATVPTPPPVISASPIVPTPVTPDLPPVLPPRPLTPQPPQIPSVVTPSPPPALPQMPTQIVTLYGHLPYQENDPQRLVQVGSYYNRIEYLDIEAAEAFKEMKSDAKANGISLKLISGFRSIADQEQLFTKQTQRRGSKEAASKLSAPPGYSEHHTGYAIDIGDEQQPNTDLKFEFEDTKAYLWLTTYAANYGFELSFPRNNFQKVSFEPWHWRYVASPRSQQIFATARSLNY